MITNIPRAINPQILQRFEIGSVEAPQDELLWDCFCDIAPVKRFLEGRKDILLGAKGAGKSAVFTLLKRRRLEFKSDGKHKQYIVPIDQSLEYSKLKSLIAEYLKSDIPDEDVRCRFLWEIYVLYRVCLEANRQSILDDSNIKKQVDDFLSAFSGESTAPTLMQMLAATKKTVGVKLNASNPAFPVPDFYVSVEPSINTATQGDNILKVDFASIKDGLAAALKKSKSVIYVLVDNIDDFVAREEYKIQKLLLQGLVQTARDYTGYPQIKVKLFLRTELYRKLDFTQLGGVDKIGQRTVELTWTASNIRQFLAERILYNLSRLLEIRAFEFRDNGISVHLDRKSKSKDTWWVLLFEKLNSLLRRSNNHDARSARRVDTMDVVYGSAITTLFPRTVTHFSPQGQEQQLDLFEYLETHFSLSNGETTPRVILLFFDKVISISSAYYSNNPDDDEIELDYYGEYPLFKRQHLMQAYSELQHEMMEIFKNSITHRQWREMPDVFLQRKRKQVSFAFRSLQKLIGIYDEDNMLEFLAYLGHLGVIRCRDKSEKITDRVYELPKILQPNWYAHR